MSRLVLHIGLAKTGTTAFQQFIAANRRPLADHGVAYCDMLRGPNHAQLPVAFASGITRISESLGVTSPRDQERLRRRLRRRLRAGSGRAPAWIASSEHMSTMLRRPADIAALAEFLHDCFDQVDVIVAIRRADYWLPSAYAEYVTSGGRRPFDAAFVRRRGYFLRHRGLLARWEREFGAGHVRAVPFLERDKTWPRALPARIMRQAGVPARIVRRWPMPSAPANVSLSAEATELLRLLNPQLETSALRPTTARNNVATYIGAARPGPAPLLTPDAADELARQHLVHPRIGRTRFAAAPGWTAWQRQPDAPTATTPTVAADQVAAIYAELGSAGLLEPKWNGATAETIRRWAIRLTRR